MIPKGAETVEMVDGRVYFSTDNWATVYRLWRGNSHRWRIVTDKQEADLARFLAVAQSSAGP
jgi:hypothetical protein